MTFCEKADMQKMMTVLQFWLFLLVQGAQNWSQKHVKEELSKKIPKWWENGPLEVPFGRLLGHFLAPFLHVGFR